MEEIALGVMPATSITPEGDPFVQQLLAENNRLVERNQTLERRLARYKLAYSQITAIVQKYKATLRTE